MAMLANGHNRQTQTQWSEYVSNHLTRMFQTYIRIKVAMMYNAPIPQLAPRQTFDMLMMQRMNAVSQKTGSMQLSIIFALVLAHFWKRYVRWLRIS